MSDTLKLSLTKRDTFGKKAAKLAKEGVVLGNIYGKGLDSLAVQGDAKVVKKIVDRAGKNHPIDVEVDGELHLTLIHEVATDPVSQRLHHVSFHQIRRDEKVEAEVPVKIVGDIPAEHLGLMMITPTDTVVVEALATNLPDHFEVDGGSLNEDGDTLTVADIKLPSGVVMVSDLELPIARIETPRSAIEEESAEEEATDAADVPSEHGGESSDDSEAGE